MNGSRRSRRSRGMQRNGQGGRRRSGVTRASSEDGGRSEGRTTRSAGLAASQNAILCEEKKEDDAVPMVAFNLTGEEWRCGVARRRRRRIPVGREREGRYVDVFLDRSLEFLKFCLGPSGGVSCKKNSSKNVRGGSPARPDGDRATWLVVVGRYSNATVFFVF